MKKIIAFIMAVVLAFSAMSISVYAEDASEISVTVNGIEFIFEAGTSEEFIDKFIGDYFNPEDNTQTYGITCTLLGHDIETSRTIVITHNARTSAPRCLKKYYNVETCSRCDYTSKTLLGQEYIYCC
ncbi:MAG: hypothetical protein IJE48_05790 [Clostridia bacterium]|nr:hypothetical protein [Clostridia bacterium]